VQREAQARGHQRCRHLDVLGASQVDGQSALSALGARGRQTGDGCGCQLREGGLTLGHVVGEDGEALVFVDDSAADQESQHPGADDGEQDWKHYVSEFWRLQPGPGETFVPTAIDPLQRERFVPYSEMELDAAINEAGGDGWLGAWRRGRAHTYVAVSLVEVRISAKVDDVWRVVDVVASRCRWGAEGEPGGAGSANYVPTISDRSSSRSRVLAVSRPASMSSAS